MWNFIKKIFIFLIPLGLILVFPLVVFCFSREYYTTDMIVKAQLKNPEIICGKAYGLLGVDYKQRLMIEIDPSVVVLGSSRVSKFKKEFFKESSRFFNFGNKGNFRSVENFKQFIEELSANSQIKVILLSLDTNEFVSDVKPLDHSITNADNSWKIFIIFLKTGWWRVYDDYFYHKFSWHELLAKSRQSNNIGLSAIINDSGHRIDGAYGESQSNHLENLTISINDEVAMINRGSEKPEYGNSISTTTINLLDQGLQLAKKKNIQVIGFFSPRPSLVWQAFSKQNRLYKNMVSDLPVEVNKVFLKNNFNFYDFSDLKILNGKETEFSDWLHVTDKMNLRMVIYMAERNKELKEYVDIKEAQRLLEKSKGDFLENASR